MYFHPLQEELGNLSDEDISKRIRELTKKKTSAVRFSRNPDLVAQINNALESYRTELRHRRLKNLQDNFKNSKGEPDLGELVNIE
jgi:hypothetical protein|tara:strand:+ start:329 stop:583 length:255 start_codon:yes stop_codon:yes gene_type:complete